MKKILLSTLFLAGVCLAACNNAPKEQGSGGKDATVVKETTTTPKNEKSTKVTVGKDGGSVSSNKTDVSVTKDSTSVAF